MPAMPANAIIVHGSPDREEYYDPLVPSPSNSHWLPWLAKQLIVRDIPAHTPEMPQPYEPVYADWCREFERYDLMDATMLVGHSYGGGFLARYLSDRPDLRVGRVVLVAPWLGVGGTVNSDFFDFTLDPELAGRTRGLIVINSDNDGEGIQASVRLLRATVTDLDYRELPGLGHFVIGNLPDGTFPALLDALTTA
jgi:uncharacterized protein